MTGPDVQTRILLIDDDELSRAVLELHLSAAGYRVTQAESGDAAVALLGATGVSDSFDVILSDLQMPGLCGPALATQLRARVRPNLPLIAMSGSQPAPEQYAGFDGFLLKPFSVECFEAALHAVPGLPRDIGSDLTDAPAVLDEGIYGQLASMMKPAQISDLFLLSLSELESHLARMQASFKQGDLQALRAAAHAMKGGFSILGARELQALGAVLESGSQDPADQAATLSEIPLAAERLRRILTSRGLQLSGSRSSLQETK